MVRYGVVDDEDLARARLTLASLSMAARGELTSHRGRVEPLRCQRAN